MKPAACKYPELGGDPGCVMSCHLKKLYNHLHSCLHNAYSFVRWCPGNIDRFMLHRLDRMALLKTPRDHSQVLGKRQSSRVNVPPLGTASMHFSS